MAQGDHENREPMDLRLRVDPTQPNGLPSWQMVGLEPEVGNQPWDELWVITVGYSKLAQARAAVGKAR